VNLGALLLLLHSVRAHLSSPHDHCQRCILQHPVLQPICNLKLEPQTAAAAANFFHKPMIIASAALYGILSQNRLPPT
jgi:hypothetical protein